MKLAFFLILSSLTFISKFKSKEFNWKICGELEKVKTVKYLGTHQNFDSKQDIFLEIES